MVGGPKSRGVIAVAQAWVTPASASASVATTRARSTDGACPAGIASASGGPRCPGVRGATSTRSRSVDPHRACRSADVARMAGVHQHEARRIGRGGIEAGKIELIIRSHRGHRFGGRPSSTGTAAIALSPAGPAPPLTCPRSSMAQALHPMLNTAIKAARAAGKIINRASLDLDRLKVNTKSPRDFVTEVDQAAEDVIIDTLLAAYPGHAILAEESGSSRGARDSEYVWIIDPLDGTTNFIHGLPVYAVSIALAHRGQVQQAVVYDPTRNDLFFASRGVGVSQRSAAARLQAAAPVRVAGRHGLSVPQGDNLEALHADLRGRDAALRRAAPAWCGGARPVLRRGGLLRRLLRDRPEPGTSPPAR